MRDLSTEENGRRRRRIEGADGSWPAERANGDGVVPKRPPLCMLYEDLADIREPAPVFGMYPAVLIAKMLPWLKCPRSEVLHVCSGGLPPGEGIRVDIRPEAAPDILADGRALPLADGSASAVMIDPPYTEQYARDLYGVDYPRPSHLLREAARVVRPGGRIVFVHYFTPSPPPGCHFVTARALSTGFGFPWRSVAVYERGQDHLFVAPAPSSESAPTPASAPPGDAPTPATSGDARNDKE